MTKTDYFSDVGEIAQILVDAAVAADPWEPKVDTDALRGLVAEDPWVLQRPLRVMEFTAREPGALPGGISWGEITRRAATAAMEADAAHEARNLLAQYDAPDDDDDDDNDDEVYDGPGIRFLYWAPAW